MSFGKTNYRDGGNRGGHDRFQWQDVKEDKFRENYLGHSIKAPTGRWQKNKDLFWFNKVGQRGVGAEERRRQELEEIRRRDEDLINQALGLAPKQHAVVESKLEPEELKQLLAKGTAERDRLDVERVEGLGAAPAARHEHIPKISLVEREIERMKKAEAEGKEFQYEDGALEDAPEGEERGRRGGGDSDDDDLEEGGKSSSKNAKKAEKKRKREEKKERKKEKKRLKKEAKEKGEVKGNGRGEGGGDMLVPLCLPLLLIVFEEMAEKERRRSEEAEEDVLVLVHLRLLKEGRRSKEAEGKAVLAPDLHLHLLEGASNKGDSEDVQLLQHHLFDKGEDVLASVLLHPLLRLVAVVMILILDQDQEVGIEDDR